MRQTLLVAVVLLLAAGCVAQRGERPIVIGAVYPTGGSQSSGGIEEFRGVTLAADYVNQQGGINGRRLHLQLAKADSSDAAPAAVDQLANAGITVVLGSYGSTISASAAEMASKRGLVFWETGAVGELGMGAASGERVFRFAPTGAALGRAAVVFVRDQLTPRLHRTQPLRYSVAYVNDVYGRAVGVGATTAILESHLPLGALLPYDLARVDYDELARRIAKARTDVLVVAAYLNDGAKLRRAIVRAKVPLVANIGTSSSYCMPLFGQLLGPDAVGLFASDKPDGEVLSPDRLAPEAARTLQWATAEYRRRYKEAMSAPALSGFAGGWALFHYVFTRAHALSPDAVARAAREIHLPAGTLPNGSGLAFAPPGGPDGGANLLAASVIWEWVQVNTRAIVWPPTFATHPIVFP